uniref:Secreted protein n=1 Tax=Mesocestoides corti TaxID=53468 RepID=A0A5K3FY29_MESCO
MPTSINRSFLILATFSFTDISSLRLKSPETAPTCVIVSNATGVGCGVCLFSLPLCLARFALASTNDKRRPPPPPPPPPPPHPPHIVAL